MRRFPDKTESERGTSDPTGGPAVDCDPTGRRLSPQVVAAPGQAERARDKARNNRGNAAETPATPGGGASPAVETSR